MAGLHSCLFQVRRFQEKPAFQVAERLFKTGSLWNTFVMVGHVGAFLKLAFESVPELIRSPSVGSAFAQPSAAKRELRIGSTIESVQRTSRGTC